MNLEQHISTYQTDKGGIFDITKQTKKFSYNNKEWTYISSGLVRDVFISDCGKFVIKIPRQPWGYEHNQLEYEVYRDSPIECKDNIAKTELTEENYVIQEYLEVFQSNNHFRELGKRKSDGKIVIFDCDIFLGSSFQKPKHGFKYQQVFCKSKAFEKAYEWAIELPKIERRKQREAIKKYFPNIDNQEFRNTNNNVYIDGQLIANEIAIECGFIITNDYDY